MCNYNCKGRLIYKAHLLRKEYNQYLKVYRDDYDNLSYDVLNEDYSQCNDVSVFGCKNRFPDVIQEVAKYGIIENVKKYFDVLLNTGSFDLVDSRTF